MAFTGKQIRNGADQGAPGHNSAIANEGPMDAPPMEQATAAGMKYQEYGAVVFAGGDIADKDLVIGSTFQWDDGLAVNDVEGGGSS